jgi:cyclic pyranopterin phosphate synthase
MYLCLFATQGYDLKPLIRSNGKPEDLTQAIANIWSQRSDSYSELRSGMSPGVQIENAGGAQRKVEMSYIGG